MKKSQALRESHEVLTSVLQMLSEEEIISLIQLYELSLNDQLAMKRPNKIKIYQIYSMIDFLSAWGMCLRNKVQIKNTKSCSDKKL